MATITKIRRADCIKYRAQVRVKKEGRVLYSKTQTFNSKRAAEVWGIKHEDEISENGIPGEQLDLSVAEACAKYLADLEASPNGVGRSKAQSLRAMGA